MKLRGSNLKRIKPKKRKKMEATLKKMEETRKEDAIFLRHTLQEKHTASIKNRQKFLEMIKDFEEKITKLKIQVLKFNGAINVLNEVLNAKEDLNVDRNNGV